MDVVTIEQAQEEAKVQWKEYCKAIRENIPDDAEYMKYYKSIKNALYYLSQGKHIIDLQESMKTAGLDEQYQPRLAIAKAHVAEVHFEWDWRLGGLFYTRGRDSFGWGTQRDKIAFPPSLFGINRPVGFDTVKAVVPKVPAHLLPKHPLNNYHILWEVEEGGWTKSPNPVPPNDPMLLKRIKGNHNLYAVLAVWDLTKLERAVLRGAVM